MPYKSWIAAALVMMITASCTQVRQQARPEQARPARLPEQLPVAVVEPVKTGPIKVGLLLPLTGSAAAVGQDMLNAALMALFDVGPNNVTLIPLDTASTPAGARAAAENAIGQEVELILGPLFAQSAATIAPLAREAGLPVISFSNDNSIAGNGVFAAGYGPEEQVKRVVEFAQRQGYSRIAAIGPDDIYGARSANAWRSAVAGSAGANASLYAPDENGMAQTIRSLSRYDSRKAARDNAYEAAEAAADSARIRQLETLDTLGEPDFDALLVADNSARLRSVAALLTYYDVDPAKVKLLGTMLWQQDRRVLSEAELQSAWFATVPPAENSAFSQRFRSHYGSEPNALAGLAYDATAMAVVIGRQDRRFPLSHITDPSGFAGQAGIFRFLENGTAQHGLAIVEVRDGALDIISPAPTSFLDGALTQ